MKKAMLFLLLLSLAPLAISAQERVEHQLTMWTSGTHTLWDGQEVQFYGFSPGFSTPVLPGPTLYANEGDTVVIRVRNQSRGAPHTIHLHGLDVDQANDGVPETSFVIGHGEDSVYTFVATHAGTYLYHCHVASVLHVQLGMYGSIVIRPADGAKTAWTGGPAYDCEFLWLMSEIDKSWFDDVPVHATDDSLHSSFMIPPYEADYFLVNGKSESQLADSGIALQALPGEMVYLRLSNIGFMMNEIVFPPVLAARIISSDGRPLPKELRRDTVRLSPGERYGVLLRAELEAEGTIAIAYRNLNTMSLASRQTVPFLVSARVDVEEGRNDSERVTLSIVPNPLNNAIRLSWNGSETASGELLLVDLQGKVVLRRTLRLQDGGTTILDISGIAAGIYVARATLGNAHIGQVLSLTN